MDVSLKPQQWVVKATGSGGFFSAGSWMLWGEVLAGVELAVYKLHSLCFLGWALD